MALPPLIRRPFNRQPPDTDLAFADWLESDVGQALLRAEKAVLDEILPSIPGQRSVQLGMGRSGDLLESVRMPARWFLGRRPDAGVDAATLPGALPLAKRSVDLILLHHSLDFEDDPHRVLRQAVSALQAGGWLVVVGFNPLSLWGVTRLLRLASGRVPWLARFFRPMRVTDWLNLLSCEVEGFESGLYAPPLGASGRRRMRWLEALGKRFWRRGGAFYVLVARKRAAAVRPLRSRFGLRERAPNVIPVPAAGGNQWRQRRSDQS